MEVDEKKIGAGIVVVLAVIFMIVGLIGMGMCFLFIWSENMVDVVGAGMGFICGAVLMGTGLISLATVTANARPSGK
jgi:hypothetical protein